MLIKLYPFKTEDYLLPSLFQICNSASYVSTSIPSQDPLHYAASSLGNCQQENSIFKSHFLQVYLFQTKIFEMHFRFLLYIWVRVDCRPTSQQIYKRTSSNLIRKGTGCDEYVEDQLNVASKNFAKYLFDDTDGKRYLLHEGLF